ncbi:hypothetical protein R1sor_006700 [Riccia sorocarpa]|uniref:Uncharacterized protein n=1 Tax=Riccia sorocarpa TaxID=122646 RepID=A0ABD3HUL1_9MARC
MENRAHLTFRETEDTELIPCTEGKAVLHETFFKARWDLAPSSIYISERTISDGEVQNYLVNRSADHEWTLESGKQYIVRGLLDSVSPALQTAAPATRNSSQERSTIDEAGSTSFTSLCWDGIPNDPSMVSTFHSIRHIRGSRSELSRLELANFTHQLVLQLPDRYNGLLALDEMHYDIRRYRDEAV